MLKIGPVLNRFDERLSINSPIVKDPHSPLLAEMMDSLSDPSQKELRREFFYHIAGSLPRARIKEIFLSVMRLQSEGLRIPLADGSRFAQRAIIRLELSLLMRPIAHDLSKPFQMAWMGAQIAYPLLETCYDPVFGIRPIPIFDFQEQINQQYFALYERLLPIKGTLDIDERVTLHRIEDYLERPVDSFCHLSRERMAYLALEGQNIEREFDIRAIFEL